MVDFLDKYTSCGNTKKQGLAVDKGYAKWKNDNAQTILDGINIKSSVVGVRTAKVLTNLDPSSITPKKDEQLRIRTQSELNMISVVISLCQNRKADEVIISTYSLNKEALDILCAMYESRTIKKLSIIMASSISYRNPDHKLDMINKCNDLGFNLAFVYSHLKILLMRIGDDYYQSEGSMNFSRNNSAENLIIENNKKMYDHDRHFLLHTMLSKDHKAIEIIR